MSTVRSDIPKERLINFDIRSDDALRYDPFARLGHVRDRAPRVAYSEKSGGWLVFGRREIQLVLRQAETFSSAHLGGAELGGPGFIPLSLDPPEHAPWRHLLLEHLGPRQVELLEPFVRNWAARFIAPLGGRASCEFVSAVAEPMPISIFMVLMGLPLDRFEEFRSWVVDGLAAGDDETRAASRIAAHQRIQRTLRDLIDARRQEPRDDLVSKLLADRIDGRAITQAEMMSICYLLFLAGLDTVTNAMAYGMRHLAGDAEMQADLRRDPRLIPGAVEKLLKLYTFVNTMRVAKHDAELDGVTIRAGELVWCVLWAGSNDDASDSRDRRHLAFGSGHHVCLGMHLARLELRVMLETWFAHVGTTALARDEAPAMRGGAVMSISRLLLTMAPLSDGASA